ncbi:MAG: hypothetical protein E5X33_23405 [Mesorhizobium sp.]|nr:hypothetical protein EOD29_12310 [Mesorhizobium sp. M1A.T.Ca.IN.004.03.1.1]RWI92836.1 MAG: hypothetical protein EOR21_17040 [Mesorhizobium sp.]RWI93506.1 MAG: hypothetical protein EOR22_15765 [Mesorhizobium sp.]RWK34980.1 MAG: hypothetical protein EOR40_16335 [Mesorhizobium sp.]RWK85385.1 MAG: hypothetical protein EOR52_27410 [Mesorhizobium sp.]
MREKVSPKAMDEECSSGVKRRRSLEHPSSVSALRADPPSPTRGEGKGATAPSSRSGRQDPCRRNGGALPRPA